MIWNQVQVMTSVYGVTHLGAREQVRSRLRERGLEWDDDVLFLIANYAATVGRLALSAAPAHCQCSGVLPSHRNRTALAVSASQHCMLWLRGIVVDAVLDPSRCTGASAGHWPAQSVNQPCT